MTRKASVHRASALPGASFRLWAEASLYKDEQIGEVCANVKQQVQQTQRALVLCTNLSQFDPIWPDLSWLLCWLFLFFQPDQCLGCMSEVLDNALSQPRQVFKLWPIRAKVSWSPNQLLEVSFQLFQHANMSQCFRNPKFLLLSKARQHPHELALEILPFLLPQKPTG